MRESDLNDDDDGPLPKVWPSTSKSDDGIAVALSDRDQPVVGQIGEQIPKPLSTVVTVRRVINSNSRSEDVKRQFVVFY